MIHFLRMTMLAAVIVSQLLHAATLKAEANEQPNVIFILCDDMGWGDLGVFHQNESKHDKKFSTPNLDKMARDGAQLRNHYCPAPVCAPSRASLLLGVHQGNCEIRDNQFDKKLPDNHTLGTVMKSAGYTTAMVGKYGLQGKSEGVKKEDPGSVQGWAGYPTKRGFDDFFGAVRHVDGHVHYPANHYPLGNSKSHQVPKELWHNDDEISAKLDKCYSTDLFTAYAKHWVGEQVSEADKPFFLYLAYDTPHAALQVPTMAFPKGQGVNGGLQWLGNEGQMINTAQGKIDSYRHDDYTGKGWSDAEERFATMVRRIDDCVGDLLQTLKDLGVAENTLVVFSSDNGPHSESYLQSVPYDPTSFQSYGPFDGIKRDTWEGGIRVPTLAWWPTKIPAETVDTTPSQFQDWMATFADVAGVAPPAICDGVTLLPTVTNSGDRDASTVYVEYSQSGKTPNYDDFEPRKQGRRRKQMQVLMLGGYKGIRTNIKDHTSPFEIYDLRVDPSELNDLANSSDAMKELQRQMQSQVLRVRRKNSTAPRPYDGQPIAALPAQPTSPGILVDSRSGDFQYVPNFDSLSSQSGNLRIIQDPGKYVASLDANQLAAVYHFKGYIAVPKTGKVAFQFQSDTPAFVRIHETVLFDNDFHHQADKKRSTQLALEEGNHPIEITILGGTARPNWQLTGALTKQPKTEIVAGKWRMPIGK
ncbi:uncharacterized sulfatase [Neorhodopirellula lusitana]|uniref:Uncharacterized sulfatase n=1 Tax=Neorhodopirellula lusitana TaxID=445327 RepID=A0ABY1Q236_9BACT|nr:sulfatase-like hydrolase/transferase [Neorhodopirellula lusitana]SMP57020.1 uncharacterized sulfatase [Neorhodopirellula lusitana]